MAENLQPEEGRKGYPKRPKKTLFDEETWEVSKNRKQNRKTNKTNKSIVENRKFDENNSNIIRPHCRKCMQVFKSKEELNKHELICLIPNKMESFLKYHPRGADNPRVVLEKVVVPSSQSGTAGSQDISSEVSPPVEQVMSTSGQTSALRKEKNSYAEATKLGSNVATKPRQGKCLPKENKTDTTREENPQPTNIPEPSPQMETMHVTEENSPVIEDSQSPTLLDINPSKVPIYFV